MSEKLTIKDETAAIDMGARDLWDSFTDDQRKQVSFFLLNRYASSVKTSNSEAQALAIFKTNEYYNKYFFNLSKHPKLLWYLVCMTGNDEQKIYFHEYIKVNSKRETKAVKFLSSIYPNMKSDEIELLSKLRTLAELKELARDMGMTDQEIKTLL